MENENFNKSIHALLNRKCGDSYERYHFLYNKMMPFLKPKLSVLDIGFGDASFLYFLKKRHADYAYYGLDISQELIDKARAEHFLSGVNFVHGDARYFKIDMKFDIAIMSGVLSIFDDIQEVLCNVVNHLKQKGVGFIFGGFTSRDIDVLVRYRNNYANSQQWESGLNMFSLETVTRSLSVFSDDITFEKFELKSELEPVDDPIRSFTIQTNDGRQLIACGANIIHEFYVVKFVKK